MAQKGLNKTILFFPVILSATCVLISLALEVHILRNIASQISAKVTATYILESTILWINKLTNQLTIPYSRVVLE
jgi:hypothetical protein